MWYVWARGEVHGNMREKGHFEEPGVDGRKNIKIHFRGWWA
jgi:hypothetical protein